MVIRRSVRGIAFVLMMMGLFSVAMAITITPSGDQLATNVTGESRNFTITTDYNATVTWYLNGTVVKVPEINVTSSFYYNGSAATGFWNVSAIAVNASNPADIVMTRWWWTVTPLPGGETSPNFTSTPIVDTLTDTSVNISFSLNQSNALTNIYYGTTPAPDITWVWGAGDNSSTSSRKIYLPGLTQNTLYYYSVYAYNSSNHSYYTSSVIDNFTTVSPTAPNFTSNPVNDTPTDTSVNISFSLNQSNALTNVYYGTTPAPDITWVWGAGDNSSTSSRKIYLPGLTQNTLYYYSVYAYNGSNQSYYTSSSISNFSTKFPSPKVLTHLPVTPLETIGSASVNFSVSFDQIVNVSWSDNGGSIGTGSTYVTSSYYQYNNPSVGTHIIKVSGNNTNGTGEYSWNWTVRPKTYETGNRVWDGSKGMSLTYKWNPMSFYGFYYDVDSDVGNETLQIKLANINDRTIEGGTLTYSTTPDNVSFKYKNWGRYDVIGFMADKYFAGYTTYTSTDITGGKTVSTLSYNQLHKILRDDNNQTAVYVGSSLTLSEGYVLKVNDVGTGRIVMLSLLKDGGVVDTGFVESGKTYTFIKRVGSANDLPIIAVHIESVFQGNEASAAFIKGIFQISESYTAVNTNNRYGIMEITDAGVTGIKMDNKDSITLSQGATIDIMGDIKFVVADDPNVLRFAPIVVRSGTYEVRGTISANDTSFEWNPMNFEGFYYNLNNDVGTEKLNLTRSGTVVSKDNLIYTTTAQPVSFKYKNFGQFNVIGFMADKYFAGYIANQGAASITKTDISTLGYKQLHRVLVDDDAQRIIYAGSTLTMNDGYVIKIKDVNMGAGSAQVWLSLLKDGNEVFDDIKNEGETFTYAPSKTGSVNNLPILALHIDKIFRGTEATAAFAKGAFQISESYTTISNGNDFGLMEISNVNDTMIEMKNPSSLTLSPGSAMDVMGNIKFRVADDSTTVRFYPFIMANGSALAANQLSIDVPASPMVRDTITITVTAGSGTPIENAEVSFDSKVIGNTNSTGKLDYLLISSGQHTITATKLGYDKATKTITVSEYRDITLKFEIPPVLDQGIPISIKVVSNGTAISGANVTFNGASIGRTDSSGILSYTFDVSGTHNLGASKAGYISVLREITIRAPFTEFKALDINFKPNVIFRDQKFLVWANITNVGTKNGTLPVGLLINDTVVENKNVTLAPGLIQEVSFTPKVDLSPGNYTVEILGQKKTLELKEEPVNILLVGGIVTALGSVVIYLSTTLKGKETIDMLTKKFNVLMASQKK